MLKILDKGEFNYESLEFIVNFTDKVPGKLLVECGY